MRSNATPLRALALTVAATTALGVPAIANAETTTEASANVAVAEESSTTTSGEAGNETSGAGAEIPTAGAAAILNGTSYTTAQAAIDDAESGDTVYLTALPDGIGEHLRIAGKAITITSQEGATATITGTLTLDDADGSKVSGIAFTRIGESNDTAQTDFTSITLRDSTNVAIENCSFTFAGGGSTTTNADGHGSIEYLPFPSNDEARTGILVTGDSDRTSVTGTTFRMSALSTADIAGDEARTWCAIKVAGGAGVVNDLSVSNSSLTLVDGGAARGEDDAPFAYRFIDAEGTSASATPLIDGLAIDNAVVTNDSSVPDDETGLVAALVEGAGDVHITGGSLEGAAGIQLGVPNSTNAGNGTVAVSGVAFASATGINYAASTGGDLTLDNCTFGADVITPLEGLVARTEAGAYFASLSRAAEIADGRTVSLIADAQENVTVPSGMVLALDLAGHTLTSATGDTVTNNGGFTLSDSIGGGRLSVGSTAGSALVNGTTGIASLTGGTITRVLVGDATAAGTAAALIENHGELTTSSSIAIVLGDDTAPLIENGMRAVGTANTIATATFQGGTFSGGEHVAVNGPIGAISVLNGYFSTGDVAAFARTSDTPASGSLLTVYGGTFTANPIDFVPFTFVVKINGNDTYTAMAKSNLYAGFYLAHNGDVIDEDHLAPGLTVDVDADGHYIVSCDGGELCVSHNYIDVDQSQWYHDAVDWAISTGSMTGYANSEVPRFDPNGKLSRAQVAQIFYNIAGKPVTDASKVSQFSDCNQCEWYASAVAWCVDTGLFTGYTGTDLFGPNDTISREQVATVLWRAEGSLPGTGDLSIFPDGDTASSWAHEALAWAIERGVFSGSATTGNLSPLDDITRAEAATVLMRVYA